MVWLEKIVWRGNRKNNVTCLPHCLLLGKGFNISDTLSSPWRHKRGDLLKTTFPWKVDSFLLSHAICWRQLESCLLTIQSWPWTLQPIWHHRHSHTSAQEVRILTVTSSLASPFRWIMSNRPPFTMRTVEFTIGWVGSLWSVPSAVPKRWHKAGTCDLRSLDAPRNQLWLFVFHLWESILDKDKNDSVCTSSVPAPGGIICWSSAVGWWMLPSVGLGLLHSSEWDACLFPRQMPSQAYSETFGSYLGIPYPARLIPKINMPSE